MEPAQDSGENEYIYDSFVVVLSQEIFLNIKTFFTNILC